MLKKKNDQVFFEVSDNLSVLHRLKKDLHDLFCSNCSSQCGNFELGWISGLNLACYGKYMESVSWFSVALGEK